MQQTLCQSGELFFKTAQEPYQTVGWYEGFCMDAIVKISEPAWYAETAIKACQPSAANQPET
jgi:hypothetical protein